MWRFRIMWYKILNRGDQVNIDILGVSNAYFSTHMWLLGYNYHVGVTGIMPLRMVIVTGIEITFKWNIVILV